MSSTGTRACSFHVLSRNKGFLFERGVWDKDPLGMRQRSFDNMPTIVKFITTIIITMMMMMMILTCGIFYRLPQSDASCQVFIKSRASGSSTKKADPDYIPHTTKLSENAWEPQIISERQGQTVPQNVSKATQNTNTFKSSGRKPRTARLQFWSQARSPLLIFCWQ